MLNIDDVKKAIERTETDLLNEWETEPRRIVHDILGYLLVVLIEYQGERRNTEIRAAMDTENQEFHCLNCQPIPDWTHGDSPSVEA